jgi:NtrC-family two-component system response regulator AlgB
MTEPAATTGPAAQRSTRVLVVDDERNIRATLTVCLESLGCTVTTAGSGEAALAAVARAPFDVCFLDVRLGDEDGLALLPRLLAERPELAVVVITAYAACDTAAEAIRRGAVDYLPKPFEPAQIRHVLLESCRSRHTMRP